MPCPERPGVRRKLTRGGVVIHPEAMTNREAFVGEGLIPSRGSLQSLRRETGTVSNVNTGGAEPRPYEDTGARVPIAMSS